jgi:hypothetical protein
MAFLGFGVNPVTMRSLSRLAVRNADSVPAAEPVFFDLYKTEKLRLPVNSHAVVRNLSDVDLFVGVLA